MTLARSATGPSALKASVADLVNQYLVPAAHAKNKLITAAVFPGPSLARTMVRQDWGRFELDAFLPMHNCATLDDLVGWWQAGQTVGGTQGSVLGGLQP